MARDPRRRARKSKLRRQRGINKSTEEAAYLCDACGEQIVIPVDPSAGQRQEYVEDCPVCCRPNLIHVEFDDDDGTARVWAERE